MSGGAAHGGGHCSMIVSVDEKKMVQNWRLQGLHHQRRLEIHYAQGCAQGM